MAPEFGIQEVLAILGKHMKHSVMLVMALIVQGCATGSFTLENDFLADYVFGQEDRNFTQSVSVSWRSDAMNSPITKLKHKIDRGVSRFIRESEKCINKRELFDRDHDHLGVTVFTPDDLEQQDPALLEGDRPYASLLYYGSTNITTCEAELTEGAHVDKRGFFLGILGLGIAESVQRYLHNDLGLSSNDPLGWDTQISDGGEPTFLYTWERITLEKEGEDKGGFHYWDFSTSKGVNIGYYNNVFFGADLRLGILTSPFWQLGGARLDAGTEGSISEATLYDQELPKCLGLVKTRLDCFLFIGVRARLIAYNALLAGQFRESEYELDHSDVKPIGAQVSFGASIDTHFNWFDWTRTTRFTVAFHARASEYKSDIEERNHFWAGLYFTVRE